MTALLTPEQVAERLGLGVRWVKRHLAREGVTRRPVIPCVRVSQNIARVRVEDLDAFIEEHLSR